jgi:hypothetical protein
MPKSTPKAISDEMLDTASPLAIATALFDANDGDIIATTRAFESLVRSNNALFRRVAEPLIHNACHELVTTIMRVRRKQIWDATPRKPRTSSAPAKGDHGPRLKALARAGHRSLMEFVLPGGMLLGDARRHDVLKAADSYGKLSVNTGQKCHWLRAVAGTLPNDAAQVRKTLTDKTLRQLKAEAERVAATMWTSKPGTRTSPHAAASDRPVRRPSNSDVDA